MKIVMVLAILGFVSACGSEETPKRPERRYTNAADLTVKACEGVKESQHTGLSSGYAYRDGHNTTFLDTTQGQVSACEVLESKGWDIAIFQLAGVTCLSCQEEAVKLSKVVSGQRRLVTPVVLTDFFEDYDAKDYDDFMKQFAPNPFVFTMMRQSSGVLFP